MFFIYLLVFFTNLIFCMEIQDNASLKDSFGNQPILENFEENFLSNINFNYDDKEIVKLNLIEKQNQTCFYNLLENKDIHKDLDFIKAYIYFFERLKYNYLDDRKNPQSIKKPKPHRANNIKDISLLFQKNKHKSKNKKKHIFSTKN